MSEVGFPGTSNERPRPPANLLNQTDSVSNNSSTVLRLPLSAPSARHEQKVDSQSQSDGLQVPLKPQPASGPVPTSRPAPKPRPRSMVIPSSMSLPGLNQESNALQSKSAVEQTLPSDRPAVSSRPTIIRPMMSKQSSFSKGAELVSEQTKTVADSDKTNIKHAPPPVIKPKPTVVNRYGALSELSTAGNGVSATNSSAADNAWKKPTIIRPSSMSRPSHQQQPSHRPVQTPDEPDKDKWKTSREPVQTPDEPDKDKWKKAAQPTVLSFTALLQKEATQDAISSNIISDPPTVNKPKPTVISRSRVSASDDSDKLIGNQQSDLLMPKKSDHQDDKSRGSSNHADILHADHNPPIQNEFNHELETKLSDMNKTRLRPPSVSSYSVQPAQHSSQSGTNEATSYQPLKSLPPAKPPPPKFTSTTSAPTDTRTTFTAGYVLYTLVWIPL